MPISQSVICGNDSVVTPYPSCVIVIANIVNGGFFEREGQLLEQAREGRLKGIPGIIVQVWYHTYNDSL
jgi:hypothetical protein